MGCGNNKVSRSYLTSQPITTPSARATKASVADLGAQILRLAAQEMKDSARRAEKARKARADVAKKSAAKAAATKASDDVAAKKAREREQEAEELEDAKRLLITTAFRVALEPVRLPGQPEKTVVQNRGGEHKEIPSWVRRVGEDGSFHELRDADGKYTHGPLHIHSIIEPTGRVVLKATDRRQGAPDHFADIEIAIPYPPEAMYDAAFEVISDLLRERA
jgi:hypothetical protein